MLLSMTGFGDARGQSERLNVAVEVRSVNNRYLKISTKCPEPYNALEGEIEKTVRGTINRGTVSVAIRLDRAGDADRYVLDEHVLQQYWRQLNRMTGMIHVAPPSDIASLLQLPGVVVEQDLKQADPAEDWPLIRETLVEALEKLGQFRRAEGRSMLDELLSNCRCIADQLDRVADIAPQVVRDYRDRLLARVRELLGAGEASVGESDLIREVSVFADRCDINEEITRLRAHLEQFENFLNSDASQGRKLEFLSQEMFREVNTIGAKANNVDIAHAVVEMKSAVEKMREILQNVE